jgi:hypothetical protein
MCRAHVVLPVFRFSHLSLWDVILLSLLYLLELILHSRGLRGLMRLRINREVRKREEKHHPNHLILKIPRKVDSPSSSYPNNHRPLHQVINLPYYTIPYHTIIPSLEDE